MKKLNSEEFEKLKDGTVSLLSKYPTFRKGQAAFIVLESINFNLANSVRGTSNDPFYMDSKMDLFLLEILDETAYQKFCESGTSLARF